MVAAMRKSIAEVVQQGDAGFRWRGTGVSRIESLFDVVVALALTLLVVSNEVPQSFSELKTALRQLPGFAVCFAILLMVWYYHFRFHRRFGLENVSTLCITAALMFLVVFYVYPLKFLFSFILADPHGAPKIDPAEVPTLMTWYHTGFASIFFLLGCLNAIAYRHRTALELTPREQLITLWTLSELAVYVAVAGLAGGVVWWTGSPFWSGLTYAAIGPLQFLNGLIWGARLPPVSS